jgi:hypothetical protein
MLVNLLITEKYSTHLDRLFLKRSVLREAPIKLTDHIQPRGVRGEDNTVARGAEAIKNEFHKFYSDLYKHEVGTGLTNC